MDLYTRYKRFIPASFGEARMLSWLARPPDLYVVGPTIFSLRADGIALGIPDNIFTAVRSHHGARWQSWRAMAVPVACQGLSWR